MNNQGESWSFCITPGTVDARQPVPKRVKAWVGTLFGDRGYSSKKLAQRLASQEVYWITPLKKNLTAPYLELLTHCCGVKRSLMETLNDQLKNMFALDHSRHRSWLQYLSNMVACLRADSYQDKKPSLDGREKDLWPFVRTLKPN